jgi:transcription-repair coupling factor (superfamily II helicase)
MAQAQRGKKAILACYSTGSRARITSILAEAQSPGPAMADTWQEALGIAANKRVTAIVLPLETGFSSDTVEVVTEQDLLGDRLVRRKKKKKSADAFLAELSALAPGDLVVHMDHGIGKYDGLQSVPVGGSPHDCVMLTYAGGTSSTSRSRTSTFCRGLAPRMRASRWTSSAARHGRSAAPS